MSFLIHRCPFTVQTVLQLLTIMLVHNPVVQTNNSNNCSRDVSGINNWTRMVNRLNYLESTLDETRFNHDLTSTCPSIPNIDAGGFANNMSLCPWRYEMDLDYNRYPHEMPYARCTCGTCPTTNPHGHNHRCQPLYHSFRVLYRVCENTRFRYYYSNIRLPVACVCSHPNIPVVRSSQD